MAFHPFIANLTPGSEFTREGRQSAASYGSILEHLGIQLRRERY
jgi:hypothetical protein